MPKAGDAERFAWRRENAPAGDRRGSLGDRVGARSATEHECRTARAFGGELKALGGSGRELRDFADDPGETGVAQALLHREQHIGVAARLDMNDAVRVETGQIERGGEQVAPPEAPEYRSFDPSENPGEKDRGCRIVAKRGATGHLVKRSRRQAAARQMAVDRRNAEWRSLSHPADAFDGGDTGAQVGNDSGLPHGFQDSGAV